MTPLESVARAICARRMRLAVAALEDDDIDFERRVGLQMLHNGDEYRAEARAAIEALMSPSGEMIEAGHRAHTADRGSGHYFDTTPIFRAMLAKVLEEK